MKRRSPWSFVVACSFLACTGNSSPPVDTTAHASTELRLPTVSAARASLLAADAALANDVTLRGVDALLGALSDDALLLARRKPLLVGRSAIVDYFAANALTGALGWRYALGDVSALGDFGYTFGWSEVLDKPDDAGAVGAHYGIYAAVWQRYVDKWKIDVLVRLELTGAPAPAPAGFLPLTVEGPVFPTLRSTAETERELIETDAAFAALTAKIGRQKGFDAYVAEDGVQIDDPFILGRKAIFDANAKVPPNSTLLWSPLHAHGAKSSDLGFTVGTYEAHSIGDDGAPRVGYGKYLTLWRRGADGHWKFVLDGGNSSPLPSP